MRKRRMKEARRVEAAEPRMSKNDGEEKIFKKWYEK